MSDDAVPMVGIVVVNYFGGDLTVRCLESLERLTWPTDRLAVALVDNGSEPRELEAIRTRFPTARVVETGSNIGFGGACNRGFELLRDCEYVALLNNDAVAEPGWLEPLVGVLEENPRVGAVSPRILLTGRYVSVELRSGTVQPGGGDPRRLGVQLCGARVDGEDVSDRIQLASGFWGWEHDADTVGGSFSWTDGAGVCRIPVPPHGGAPRVELRLACGTGRRKAEVSAGDDVEVVDAGVHPEWVDLGVVGVVVDLINSAGTVLLAGGETADRGYMHPDGPEFGDRADVFGWSGAAVLLSRRYLEDVGTFDERFFLYYEDADLSWRGRRRGWSYRYEPCAVVRHDHSATIGERSPMAQHLLRRNRLLTLVKNAPAPVVARAIAQSIGAVLAATIHDVVGRARHLRTPVWRHAADEARVLAAVAPHLPRALRHRWRTSGADRAAVWNDHAAAARASL